MPFLSVVPSVLPLMSIAVLQTLPETALLDDPFDSGIAVAHGEGQVILGLEQVSFLLQ